METTAHALASRPFLGQWQTLVSTTNWEKGRIISEWRAALIAAEVDRSDYADEAWSQLVGNVTPQHVGRLRRVFERFGEQRETFMGLYWSHFQAALDWEDAEMWLEGAKGSDWSVSQMRAQRAETLGEVAGADADGSEFSAALESGDGEENTEQAPFDTESHLVSDSAPATAKGNAKKPAARDARKVKADAANEGSASETRFDEPHELPPPIMASLPSLPADVTDAFEAFKLCILRHKTAGWKEVSCEDVLASLYALKEFALADSVA
jgi:hypothetical protein